MKRPSSRQSSPNSERIPKMKLGMNPMDTQIQIAFIPKHTQGDFGYELGIRLVSPLDFGYHPFLWMLCPIAPSTSLQSSSGLCRCSR